MQAFSSAQVFGDETCIVGNHQNKIDNYVYASNHTWPNLQDIGI